MTGSLRGTTRVIGQHLPAVSVVMPAYNAGRTIGDAIGSVMTGTFRDFEVVVCDDASTDCTADIVDRMSDPRIKLIRGATNIGEGEARDQAIAAATGQWIAMLDADDLFEPDRLAVLLTVAKAHPDAIVFDDIMECHDTPNGIRPWHAVDRGIGVSRESGYPREVSFAEWIGWRRTVVQPLVPTALIRRHGVRHSAKRFSADLEFLLTLIGRSKAKLWYVPRPMYLYRLSPTGMSTVSDRYSMLAATVEAAVPLFASDTSDVAALQRKAVIVQRSAQYYVFFSHVMHGQLVDAGREAWRKPWVIGEFLRRSAERLPYHVSRWWHRGKRRATA